MGNDSQYFASVYPLQSLGGLPVDRRIAQAVKLAEAVFDRRVFCIIHSSGGGPEHANTISPWLYNCVLNALKTTPPGKPICLLLHSPGGDAHSAYRMAKALNRHCGEYSVVIPRWAKSAATLLTLGASKIYFGEHAEMGPIDVQLDDPERERQISALEMVQSLDRLNSEALQIMDATMSVLLNRSGKRIDSILPAVLKYAADLTRPIFDKIDTVAFTYHARLLKIGEDYAKRLLKVRYPEHKVEYIAATLARSYSDHGFVVDYEEAKSLGLDLLRLPDNLCEPFGPFLPSYTKDAVIGFLSEVTREDKEAKNSETINKSASNSRESTRPSGGSRRTRNRASKDGPPFALGTNGKAT